MQNFSVMLFIVVALAGCGHLIDDDVPILKDYKVLSTPRSDVPVGANWQQSLGPNGDGVPKNHLRITRSTDTLASGSVLRQNVEANIYQMIGITADLRKNTKLELSDVEVVTVADMANIKLEPGNHFLYEAIRVGGITLHSAKQLNHDIKTAFIKQLGNSNFKVDGEATNTLKATGSNLYVAYRVVKLGTPEINRTNEKISKSNRQILGPYEISLNSEQPIKCACDKHGEGSYPSPDLLKACYKNHPVTVHVENPSGGLIGSGGTETTFPYHLVSPIQPTIKLATRLQDGYFGVDRFSMKAQLVGSSRCYPPTGYEFIDKGNIELQQVKYPFAAISDPKAAGW